LLSRPFVKTLMPPRGKRRGIRAAAVLALLPGAACAFFVREGKRGFFFIQSELRRSDVRITLDKKFVEEYKNRATIGTTFTVDRAGRYAHAGYLDGDLHVAGRAEEIGLPIVAEVENAASKPAAVEMVHRLAGTGEPVRLTGVWRLWSEHFGKGGQTQGDTLAPFEKTNPPHVFEVHPVTRLGGLELDDTFHPVPGFRPEPAGAVLESLKDAKLRIVPEEKTITLYTRREELNDADFTIEIGSETPLVVSDGRFVTAAVVGPRGNRLADRVRLVFVRDTAPEKIARSLASGDRLHVFGIPRIDLSAVSYRVEHAAEEPGALDGKLPYEIVVVGIFPKRAARRSRAGAGETEH